MPDNDRIDRILATLPSLLFSDDHLGARALLEELYDAAQDDLMRDLCGAEQAAARWDVSERRARAHIARLHEKYGIGAQLGGMWLIRRAHLDTHAPDAKYRVKTMEDAPALAAEVQKTGIKGADGKRKRRV